MNSTFLEKLLGIYPFSYYYFFLKASKLGDGSDKDKSQLETHTDALEPTPALKTFGVSHALGSCFLPFEARNTSLRIWGKVLCTLLPETHPHVNSTFCEWLWDPQPPSWSPFLLDPTLKGLLPLSFPGLDLSLCYNPNHISTSPSWLSSKLVNEMVPADRGPRPPDPSLLQSPYATAVAFKMVFDSCAPSLSLFCHLHNISSRCIWFLFLPDAPTLSSSWSTSTVLLRHLPCFLMVFWTLWFVSRVSVVDPAYISRCTSCWSSPHSL